MAAVDGSGFRVDPAALETHAGVVEKVAGGVEQARAAGASILVGSDAYGILCSFLPTLLEPAQRQAVDALASVSTGLRTAATGVRDAAQSYVQLDEANASAYRRVTAT